LKRPLETMVREPCLMLPAVESARVLRRKIGSEAHVPSAATEPIVIDATTTAKNIARSVSTNVPCSEPASVPTSKSVFVCVGEPTRGLATVKLARFLTWKGHACLHLDAAAVANNTESAAQGLTGTSETVFRLQHSVRVEPSEELLGRVAEHASAWFEDGSAAVDGGRCLVLNVGTGKFRHQDHAQLLQLLEARDISGVEVTLIFFESAIDNPKNHQRNDADNDNSNSDTADTTSQDNDVDATSHASVTSLHVKLPSVSSAPELMQLHRRAVIPSPDSSKHAQLSMNSQHNHHHSDQEHRHLPSVLVRVDDRTKRAREVSMCNVPRGAREAAALCCKLLGAIKLAGEVHENEAAAPEVWLTRHGESQFNLHGRLGGNPGLSENGLKYARKFAEFLVERRLVSRSSKARNLWTSALERTKITAGQAQCPTRQLSNLNEISAGRCDGMTYEDVKRDMPSEYVARSHDKLRYRYPEGESYLDVIERLEAVVLEIERRDGDEPLVIVSHQATLRCLSAYFKGVPLEQLPHLPFPLHSLVRLCMLPDGSVSERVHRLAVDD